MEKISVIIPVYNSEAYIEACINSIRNQTYPYLEILIIDDGSTDRSRTLCSELKIKDNRIQLISQKNQGVSSARNRGIESATGKYIFFLDSDDAIHPCLLAELVGKAEECQTELATCSVLKLSNRQMGRKLDKREKEEQEPNWQISKREESEEWFHRKYFDNLTMIGGKLIRRDCIGTLRFDESLTNGEDTLFLYYLICKKIRIARSEHKWYYYRMHSGNVTSSRKIRRGSQYYRGSEQIRDREYQRHNIRYAICWEKSLAFQMARSFSAIRKTKDRRERRNLRKKAIAESRHPLFKQIDKSVKILYYCSFFCPPIYVLFEKFILELWSISSIIYKAKRLMDSRADSRVGIITFHCSDNYGAMLQAYGLKKYLFDKGAGGSIIRYEPCFMTGRHWWLPYIPIGKAGNRIWMSAGKWKIHLHMGRSFFGLRANMKRFRKKYLIEKGHRKLLFKRQLRKLSFRYYIVGSDQIWNPEITLGLKDVYFGAFPNFRKEKVIAYGASLGGAELLPGYDQRFSKLIKYVDAVSLREEEAVPYVRKFYQGQVETVLDPVFLLERKEWLDIEKSPEQKDYILLYQTEYNQELIDYARKLSEETGRPVVELQTGTGKSCQDFLGDCTAGPAEFLGYIDQAAYVVSNSFHAVAFSIIFEKNFMAFLHDSRGARIRNILRIAGLENRLYEKGKKEQIDVCIDWKEVHRKIKKALERSEAFLKKNLDMQEI